MLPEAKIVLRFLISLCSYRELNLNMNMLTKISCGKVHMTFIKAARQLKQFWDSQHPIICTPER